MCKTVETRTHSNIMLKFYSSEIFLFLCLFYLAAATNVCPGDELSFTCETNTSKFTWTVTPDGKTGTTCVAIKNKTDIPNPTCGPKYEFSVNISDSNSTLSTPSVDKDLNKTRIVCADGNVNQTICIIDVLEFSLFKQPTVSRFGEGKENTCQLNLEWSEAIVSCGGGVSYILTVTPCLSGPGDCNGTPARTFSATGTQQTFTVNGSVGLEYNSTVTTETCDGRINSNDVDSVNLTANYNSSGNESFYSYVYNGSTVEGINVFWPRYYILNEEAAYRVVIDEKIVKNVTAQNCSGDMCNYVHYSDSLTSSSSVAVDIVGCVTERIRVKDSQDGPTDTDERPSGGAIAGIVIAVVIVFVTATTVVCVGMLLLKRYKKLCFK